MPNTVKPKAANAKATKSDGAVASKAKTAARARELMAPIEHITLDGVEHKLVFSNEMMRVAEDVYETAYGKDVGFGEVLKAVAKGKYAAIMALFYGALIAGGAEMSWEEYDAKFKLDSVDGIRDILMRGMDKALLPETEGGKQPQNP